MAGNILLLDDDPHILNFLEDHLSMHDYRVQAYHSPKQGLEELSQNRYDLVISDVKMGEFTGDEVLRYVQSHHPETGVILMTGFGNINHSVRAMQKGAIDYITKPFSGKEILSRINRYFKERTTSTMPDKTGDAVPEMEAPRKKPNPTPKSLSGNCGQRLIGQHPQIKKLHNLADRISSCSAPVLIRGESGSGKEVFASLIQERSTRADKPYIKINCANLPSELVESTLFGHVKGAFTGAVKDQDGAFHEADGGTLLLDEITEISPEIQAKLLRVLQEKEFTKVGSHRPQKVDVRVLATTNRNIGRAIDEGIFREDLFYRLNVIPVKIPSLNERKSDIPLLADHFCQKYGTEFGLPELKLSDEVHSYLAQKTWPGNVRELENMVQRGVILAGDEGVVRLEHIKNQLFDDTDWYSNSTNSGDLPLMPIDEMELVMIQKALDQTNGNQKEAAEMLNISDRTIRNKLKKVKAHES